MRIAIADPPFGKSTEKAVEDPNIGVLYLIGALRRAMPDLEIRYIRGFLSREEQLAELEEFLPDLLGLSFTSVYAALAYAMAGEVKRRWPAMTVICGGPHPTVEPEDVLRHTPADLCCIGEGEATFVEVVRCLREGGEWVTVAGLAWRDGDEIRRSPQRPLIENLDDIPMPAWEMIDFKDYIGRRKYRGFPSTSIQASRGCPFDCTFCSNPVWKEQKPWVRKRSPANIAAEVEYLYGRGIREIYIQSDEMNPDLKWCIEVFDALAALGHTDLYFQANLRARPLTEALAASMARTNCWLVHLGIESASQRVLDGIRKHIRTADVVAACRLLTRHRIKVFAFFMLYQVWEEKGELRVETPAEVLLSLRTLVGLRARRLIHYMSWTFATPLPGSELFRVARAHQLVPPRPWADETMSIYEISMKLPGVSLAQMRRSRTLGFLLQGLFLVTSREFYGRKALGKNLRRALRRLAYAMNLADSPG